MAENKTLAFDVLYQVDNEFEVIRTLLIIYLNSEIAVGNLRNMPGPQLINLLVFYIKHGYSSDAKKKAASFLKIDKPQVIDGFNHNLKKMGFLVESPMSKKDKYLDKSLQNLRDYYLRNKSDKFIIRSIIVQKNA